MGFDGSLRVLAQRCAWAFPGGVLKICLGKVYKRLETDLTANTGTTTTTTRTRTRTRTRTDDNETISEYMRVCVSVGSGYCCELEQVSERGVYACGCCGCAEAGAVCEREAAGDGAVDHCEAECAAVGAAGGGCL